MKKVSFENLFNSSKNKVSDVESDPLWDELKLYPAELDASLSEIMEQPMPGARKNRPFAGLAIAASLMVAVGAWLFITSAEPGLKYYQTERGERLELTLADGSVVKVNSASKLSVMISENERRIELEQGEALFDVASDPARKFLVHTRRGTVEAIGTLFNVNVYQPELVVTIAEGKVLVSNQQSLPSNRAAEMVTAGHRVIVGEGGGISSEKLEDLQAALAWTEGKIMFTGEPLHLALEQINRHGKHRIAILDARLADLPVYGVFNTGDSAGFLSALEKSYHIEAIAESRDLSYLAYRAGEQ